MKMIFNGHAFIMVWFVKVKLDKDKATKGWGYGFKGQTPILWSISWEYVIITSVWDMDSLAVEWRRCISPSKWQHNGCEEKSKTLVGINWTINITNPCFGDGIFNCWRRINLEIEHNALNGLMRMILVDILSLGFGLWRRKVIVEGS